MPPFARLTEQKLVDYTAVTPPSPTETISAPEAPSSAKPKIGFVSLGCPKNLVDSEVMMGLLHNAGGQLTPSADDAEIIVVNTCSFIDSAKQESVNTILEMAQHKQANGGRAHRLIVAGCLVERYRDEIRRNIPEVDAVVGTGELEAILTAAGFTPKPTPQPDSPFRILPQGTPESTIHTHPIGKTQTDAEVAHLIERAPSAVHQHSRPLTDREVAPQLKIVQSLAETGTTHGDSPLAHPGNHIAHIPDAGTKTLPPRKLGAPHLDSAMWVSQDARVHPASQNEGWESTTPSRPEGNLREQQGRFSRAAWDGASSTLPDYLYSDATPRILTPPRASAYTKTAEACDTLAASASSRSFAESFVRA